MHQLADPERPIACDLTALSAEQRTSHLAQAKRLLSQTAQEVQEIPNGYAFCFTADHYPQVADFIANERLCCSFFSFVLEVPPAQGALWLRITGDEGVKEFLQSNLVHEPD